MIADIKINKKIQSMVEELFFRCRKLTISLVFITQFYFFAPKSVRLNSTHYVIMKIYKKKELQNIANNHSVYIDYNKFMNIYRKCTSQLYSFLTNDNKFSTDDSLYSF